jgi:RsiW-degrading membrane proteinase PrsW (M82 family)
MVDILLRLSVGLVPVLALLGVLLYLDSYKLVSLRFVGLLIGAGVALVGVSYFLNVGAMEWLGIELDVLSRYIAPVIEELLKASIVYALIRTHRLGFVVDAAIAGFAVGTGFAVAENLYYLYTRPELGLATWLVRGCGTALMHGGATALFAMLALSRVGPGKTPTLLVLLPGFALAVVLHGAFNQFLLSPMIQAAGMAVALPPLFYFVFESSERQLQSWLGNGFDANVELLDLINEGRLTESPVGQYLHSLKDRFDPLAVVDIVCYLRLHTELAIRAKGLLMLREQGMDAPLDEASKASLTELDSLERTVGKAAMLSIRPMLNLGAREIWQLRLLGR